ncbi:MAG: DNA polymerase IV [Nitrososphaerota archaeon]
MSGPVACLDIDYFYAQAEELRNPAIRDKPVVVCVYSGRTQDSGVVATSNYVARRYGVRSGMPIRRAKELLRDVDAVFHPVDMPYYSELSRQVFEIAGGFADVIEVASIDEAFMNLLEAAAGSFENAASIMASLKKEIREKVGLTCSIGIAKNKLLAKMAADDSKPDGLLVIKPGTEDQYLKPKPIEDIPYIGAKTAKRLQEMGIKTIGDLARVPSDRIIEAFGFRVGRFIYLASRGEYSEQVTPRGGAKQVSRMITLKHLTRDEAEIWEQLGRAIRELHQRIVEVGYGFRGVSLIGVTRGMKPVTKSMVLSHHTQEMAELENASHQLLRALLGGLEEDLRRIGVRVYDLSSERGQSRLTDF